MTITSNSHCKTQNLQAPLLMDFACEDAKIAELVKSRIGAAPVVAHLVQPKEVAAPLAYRRFHDIEEKQRYREHLVCALEKTWVAKLGCKKALKLIEQFIEMAKHFDEHGAVVLAGILATDNFLQLIDHYTKVLEESGSKSWIHSYLNLANHPTFLTNQKFNAAFMHPLLIALIAYRMGGPIRIVDARAKDAEPISILAQDNMLHIDNTPFGEEVKIILTYEKGKPSGPKGQNFVFLPGTHQGVRQCMVGRHGPWSSENASIFTTRDSIEKILSFQEKFFGKRAVVELTHDTKPLTTVFSAGSLAHHRHRTCEGIARSCVIIALQLAKDNPGSLIDEKHLRDVGFKVDSLSRVLLSHVSDRLEDPFIQAIIEHSDEMLDLMMHLNTELDGVEQIMPSARELDEESIKKWMEICTTAPTVEDKKGEASIVPLRGVFHRKAFIAHVGKMMVYDKHGPLDLILYPDSHEEIRKWARNQIREKKISLLYQQLENTWGDAMKAPNPRDLLLPSQLQAIAWNLAALAQGHIEKKNSAILSEQEKIPPQDAYRSVNQLLLDLGESIVRCENKTAFLSTSLFIFWAADTLMRFEEPQDRTIKELGTQLLHNYIATAVLVEKSK